MIDKTKILNLLKILVKPIIIVILSVGVIAFSVGKIKTIAMSLSEKRTANLILEKRIENIEKMRRDLELFGEDNYKKVEEALPLPEEAIDILTLIERAGSRIGATVRSTIGSLGQKPIEINGLKINSIDFTISFTGSSRRVEELTKTIENLPYFIIISGIDINSPSQTAGWNSSSSNVFVRGRIYVKESSS